MFFPLLATKMGVPALAANLVTRHRLLERLDTALEYKLTLISAPAGYGKTTLLGEWVRKVRSQSGLNSAGGPTGPAAAAWLSLDPGDNRPGQFWKYLLSALSAALPDAHMVELEAYAGPSELALAALIQSIRPEAAPEFVLVLDNYQAITDKEIHEAVGFLIQHLYAHQHVIVSTRSTPPLPLAQFRADRGLLELKAADLRFDLDEMGTFFRGLTRMDLPKNVLVAIDHCFEGWITGLQLAALTIDHPVDPVRLPRLFCNNHRFVVDYLDEQVFSPLPPPVQSFLLYTSVLEQMSAPLCDCVLGKTNSHSFLDGLDRENLFLVHLDHHRGWYRYHGVMSSFMLEKLRQTEPARETELRDRAEAWLESFAGDGPYGDGLPPAASTPGGHFGENKTFGALAGHPSLKVIYPSDPLSKRETQILGLVAAGKSYQAIALDLFVSVSTIQWHIKNIYQKLDVHSGLAAVHKARRLGILE